MEKKDYKIKKIKGYHDLELYTYVFDQVKNPQAVIVIIHGMQEHAGRYIEHAREFNKQGFIVVMNDLRGHGKTIKDLSEYGYGEEDIYKESVQDELKVIEYVKNEYNLPIYLIGHSYGSMISQSVIQNTDLVEKCVLSGTADGSSPIMQVGAVFANIVSLFKNKKSKAGLIEKMCVGGYGKKFENGNWFSRDDKVLEEYKKDELCGGSFPFGFYKSMLSNMSKCNKNIDKIGDTEILLLAGDKDPVGSSGKQIISLNKRYIKKNKSSKYKLYENSRHEILNEINKQEVYDDIVNFFEN